MGDKAKKDKKPGPKKQSKAVIIITVIYTVFMAFYAIYGLVQAALAWSKFKDLTKSYNNIVNNWNIKDIQVVQSPAACPTGFNPDFQFLWPGKIFLKFFAILTFLGTVEACNCKNAPASSLSSKNLTAKIYFKGCNSTQTEASCANIASTPPKNMTQLPNTGGTANDGRIICVQRDTENTFVTLAENLGTDGTCKPGKKFFNNMDIDSF
jgi:hypothetical protein